MKKVFERGDIVRVNLNSTAGKEQQGDARPALVISHKAFKFAFRKREAETS